jgi:hypothetical protein
MAIHFQILIGPLKDEEAIDWCKGFRSFHWTRGTSSRKVMEAHQGRGVFFVYGRKEKEKEEENEV